jgi:DNA-binding transcriptional ArsR family regulator
LSTRGIEHARIRAGEGEGVGEHSTAARADDPLSRVFAALADPVRRDIVARLADGDATVTDLAAPYDISLQAVSKHLKVLGDAGVVSRSRDAQRRPVHLEAEVFDLATKWLERYRRQVVERFRRLDAVLATLPDEPTDPSPTDRRPTTHRKEPS